MKKIKSNYLKTYKKEMMKVMKIQFPNVSEEKLDKLITKKINETVQNPHVTLDNNYTHESRDTNLLAVVDWSMDRKPILCGNATFYKNQEEAINPVRSMLQSMLAERKAFKKQMFSIEDTHSVKYQDLDREQQNKKRSINSYYGGSGAKTSAFFSKWSGPRLTLWDPMW